MHGKVLLCYFSKNLSGEASYCSYLKLGDFEKKMNGFHFYEGLVIPQHGKKHWIHPLIQAMDIEEEVSGSKQN